MNEYYSKLAGEEDALSTFGLAHGTPRPPPLWAQEWLESARKNGTKNLTIPSMREKKAFFDPMTLALGGALHVGSNLAQKIIRKTAWGKRLEQSQFASGLRHGVDGKQLHPVTEKVLRFGLGPEALAPYEAGHATAKQIQHLPPDQWETALRHGGSALGETKHLSGAPLIRAAPGGIERFLKGEQGFMEKHLTSIPKGQKVPLRERLIAPALGAATIFGAPHAAAQIFVNKGRDYLAKKFGPRWTAKEIAAGARGQEIGPVRRALTDYVVSPAANDPRDIGLAAHREYQDAQKGVNKFLADRGHGPIPLPGADAAVNYAEGVAERLKKKPPTPAAAAPAPEQTHSGALTGALLAGGGMYALHNRDREEEGR